MLLARCIRQMENTEFVLLCSSMFGIASFSFVLLLINEGRLAMQVNVRQSFFRQCFAVALFAKLLDRQSFLLYSSSYSKIHHKLCSFCASLHYNSYAYGTHDKVNFVLLVTIAFVHYIFNMQKEYQTGCSALNFYGFSYLK